MAVWGGWEEDRARVAAGRIKVVPIRLEASGGSMASSLTYDQIFEAAMDKVKNRFLLSVILAKRVTQLRKGAEPLVDSQGLATHEEIVFKEIIEGKLEWRQTPVQANMDDMDQEYSAEDFSEVE
jgi:DNA-directed RNA polymerase subunit K/omega